MAHYASAVRFTSKWPTSSREILQSTWVKQKNGNVGTRARKQEEKKEEEEEEKRCEI